MSMPNQCPLCGSFRFYPCPSKAIKIREQNGSITEYMAYRCRKCGKLFDEKMIEDLKATKKALSPLTPDMTPEQRSEALKKMFQGISRTKQ